MLTVSIRELRSDEEERGADENHTLIARLTICNLIKFYQKQILSRNIESTTIANPPEVRRSIPTKEHREKTDKDTCPPPLATGSVDLFGIIGDRSVRRQVEMML